MLDDSRSIAIEPDALWRHLSEIDLFSGLTEEHRKGLLHALEHEPGMGVRRFAAGEIVCRKGEYELDLCAILSGGTDLFDLDSDGNKIKVASLGPRSFYGELGAIAGLPRTTDVQATEETDIFYLPRHALKYLEVNPKAREILANRYRELAVRVFAAETDLLRGVPPSFLSALIPKCEIVRYDLRGIALVNQGELGDAFYIVRDGFVQVVREHDDGSKRVLAYLRPGEYFGEIALLESGERYASVLTAGKCELIKIRKDDFLELCARYPGVAERIREIIEFRREQEKKITPEISELLERSGQLGVIQADAVLVMDLELCVKCDLCVKACEALHGKSRLIRNGITIGKYLIPSACRHCDDPKCMNSCPTGAINRRPEGEIFFQYEMCIGCGNCAIACPYDNIAMIDTPTFDKAQARKGRMTNGASFFRPYPLAAHDAGETGIWERLFGAGRKTGKAKRKPVDVAEKQEETHIPSAFPIKCDLCDGLPFMGCVHNCPTGAAMRIDPAKLFEQTGAVSAGGRMRKAKGGSD